jgi:hypothetical protein
VLHRSCCRFHEIVVADEELDDTDVVCQFLGERQRVMHETRNTLLQRVVEAFDVIRFAGSLRDSFVLGWWNHALVDRIAIRVERSPPLIDRWYLGPEPFPTLTTPVAHVKRHDLARLGIHCKPEPLPVGLLRNKAPHLISFGFQPPNDDIGWPDWQLDVSVIGTGRKTLDHKVQEPCKTDAHRPTDPA